MTAGAGRWQALSAGMWARLVLLCCVVALAAGAGPPALLWGGRGLSASPGPLAPLSSDQFERLLEDQLRHHSFTVVFVEETLSVEDFGLKDSEGNSPYASLKRKVGDDSFLYLPSVDSPIRTINKLAEPSNVDRVEMTDEGLSADILPGPGKFLYISLKDAREDEDRVKMLARHDRFVTEMVDKLSKKHHSVLAIYTAHYPSFELLPEESSRTRRHLMQTAPPTEDVKSFYNGSDKIYLYAPGMKLIRDGDNGTELEDGEVSLGTNSSTEIIFNMKFDLISLVFNFTNRNNYWNIDSIQFNDGKEEFILEGEDLGTPHGFSYHCGQVTDFKVKGNETKNGVILRMADFQVQPFFGEGNGNGKFASAYDCVGVMTVPIWSGIFLVAILLLITSGGVMMMMDIRTMDRFDDPKGKTITIAAGE